MEEITTGSLLGGRITYKQFARGHRTGFEPVLLAAAVPAKPGELVLEAGTGAGAALLCLAARIPGIAGTGIEIDPALATLANENFQLNNLPDLRAIATDITSWRAPQKFDHACANPPWFDAASTPSPDAARRRAHQAPPGLLQAWVTALAAALKPGGSLTLILPAASFPIASAVLLPAGFGGLTLLPLWPRAATPAKFSLLSARKGSKSSARILPGLVLHDEAGITQAAQAVLNGAQPISGESNTA
jgi:tRNA1(Val) A37 N6-methylase TrmN6